MSLILKSTPKNQAAIISPSLAMPILLMVANEVFTELGFDCVITEDIGGRHSAKSRHYLGLALDFRTVSQGMTIEQSEKAGQMMRDRLGDSYYILVEDDHIHAEFRGVPIQRI